jgi:hypothetical protein
MAKVTRRGLITKASIGAATLGVMAAAPNLVKADAVEAEVAHSNAPAGHSDTLIAHVRNRKTGEIALLVGSREVIVRDRELVRRLVKAAQ